MRVCCVSRSSTPQSWVSESLNGWFLSTDTKRTYSKRVEIAGMWWNMTGYRIFYVQILTLGKIWGQHTEAPWNRAYAHMFSFFLASRFETRKWIWRLQVQRVSGGHISSCSICMGRAPFLELWRLDFLVIRVCYVSRSNTLKSWVSEIVNDRFLSTDVKRTYSKRVEIVGKWA